MHTFATWGGGGFAIVGGLEVGLRFCWACSSSPQQPRPHTDAQAHRHGTGGLHLREPIERVAQKQRKGWHKFMATSGFCTVSSGCRGPFLIATSSTQELNILRALRAWQEEDWWQNAQAVLGMVRGFGGHLCMYNSEA